MNLYLLRKENNNNYGTYWGAVVAAPTEEIAKDIHPDDRKELIDWDNENVVTDDWVKDREDVIIKFIGVAKKGTKRGVIFSSFFDG